MDGDCTDGGAAITRLKNGPVNIPEIVWNAEAYTDSDFLPNDALFWDGYETSSYESGYEDGLTDGSYSW